MTDYLPPGITVGDLAFYDFAAYVKLVMPRFQFAKHNLRIISALMALERGDIDRLAISIPPRHGKTELASNLFPSWYLGRNSLHQILHGAYSQDQADEYGYAVRANINHPNYRLAFPTVKISPSSAAANKFNLTAGGKYRAVGVCGPGTGKGAHLLIIDDPIKNMEEARSESFKRKLLRWYRAVAYTRLMTGGKVLLIQTRWCEDDLAGSIIDNDTEGRWHQLNMPAINARGEALWPEFFPLDVLENIRATLTAEEWSSLYQQAPFVEDGDLFRKDWFGMHARMDRAGYDRIIMSVDTANKAGERNDKTAMIVAGVLGQELYILDILMDQFTYPDLEPQVLAMAHKWQPHALLIEDKSSGISLLQSLARNPACRYPLIPITPLADKVTRAMRVSPICAVQRVKLPAGHPQTAAFLHDLVAFPNGRYKDGVDAFTQLLSWQFLSEGQPRKPAMMIKGL